MLPVVCINFNYLVMDTPNNFRLCARQKAPEKCFKICHFFVLQKYCKIIEYWIGRKLNKIFSEFLGLALPVSLLPELHH